MRKIKLGEVLDVKRGMSLSGEYYSTEGEFIRLTLGNFTYPESGWKENNQKDDIYFTGKIKPEAILKKGDIITPLTEQVRGLLGNTATIPVDDLYIQSGDIGLVIPNEGILNKRFAYYLISSQMIKKQLDACSQQTKIRHTSPDAIKDCIAYLPDLKTQESISKIMDSISGKIEINNKINNNLQHQAKLIYDYWFNQFDFPNEYGKPYHASGGKMVYNEHLKREIPENWKSAKLNSICEIVLGGTPKKSNSSYWNGDINWLNSGEVSQFPVEKTNLKITELGLNNSATKLMSAGTTVISITGNIRTSFLSINSCANQSVVGILENNKYKKEYIYPYLTSLIKKFTSISSGNCQQHINKAEIENSFILIPEIDILNSYYCKVSPIYGEIINNSKENQILIRLRDFLLPLLMNGQATIEG